MKKLSLGLMALVLLISGCASPATQTTEPEEAPDEELTEEVAEEELPEQVEFEGEKIYDRPIMVSINNLPSAVKVQTGLGPAYLIYEVPVEGGLTRLLACFKDGNYPDLIGTCRSARHYMLDYVLDNDAIFIHFGWSKYAIKRMLELYISNVEGNSIDNAPFFRQNPEGLATEHTAYAHFQDLVDYVRDVKKYDMTTPRKIPLNYSDEEIDLSQYKDAIKAEKLDIHYAATTTQYEYDPESQMYYRYANHNPHVDYYTKEHYNFKNILIVDLDGYDMMDDGKNIGLHNLGDGYGWYVVNGYAIPIWWEKYSPYEQLKFYANGEELLINEGNTFIQLHLKGADCFIEAAENEAETEQE
ncbi:MAG: DUF3048 domain-containing protein [Erysipelotrichaceae bacterium]|nr:DUF3048 domain-containing protein [Erysipelotrichaceae bacterium]